MYLIVSVTFITLRITKILLCDWSFVWIPETSWLNFWLQLYMLKKTHITKFTMTQSLFVIFVDAVIQMKFESVFVFLYRFGFKSNISDL